jgi:hypothetical protein
MKTGIRRRGWVRDESCDDAENVEPEVAFGVAWVQLRLDWSHERRFDMPRHLTAQHLSPEMRECIDNCSDCHDVCLETVAHCIERGGAHADVEHLRTLLDCAQACDASRDFMLRGSELHASVCGVCGDACERCAASCESLGGDDEVMRNCAEVCRRCAETCRSMAGAHAH